MTTPSTTLMKLDKVRAKMADMSLSELVNHEYIQNQLSLFYGSANAQKEIEQFKSNYLVLVSDASVQKALAGADNFSILNSLICLTKDGLSINPYHKEAVIVNYGGRAMPLATAKGKVKRMQQSGIITRIQYLEVIYEGDKVSNKNGVWEHEINITRADDAKKLGVLLIALFPDGTMKSKFVRASDVVKRQAKAPFPEIWSEWPEEMWKKTAINMFENEIGAKPLLWYTPEEDQPEEENFIPQNNNNITASSEEPPIQQAEVIVQDAIKLETLKQLVAKKLLKPNEEKKFNEALPSLTNERIDSWIKALTLREEKRENVTKNTEVHPEAYNVNGDKEPVI